MSDTSPVAHISAQTPLLPAINAWRMFLNDQGRSPYTLKAFMSDLGLLASYFPPDRPLGAITTDDLIRYLDWMQNERGVPCSPKTLARRITSTKSFFRWLHQYGVLIVDPAERVPQRSVISPLPTILTEEETSAVLQAAEAHRHQEKPDARYYTLIYLVLATGIKKSECLSLHLNHIDLEAPDGPMVFIRYASPSNRYKERKIALPDDWIPAYQEYLAQYEPVDQLFPWSPRRLEYLLEDIGKEAGLVDKHLSFDMCRWTCAVQDFQSGMDPDRVRQKLGISKIQFREIHMKLRQLTGESAITDGED